MNWRIFSRKFGGLLLVALALVLAWARSRAAALGLWGAAVMPLGAFGVILSLGTVRSVQEGVLPGAVTLPWPSQWKEVDVRDVRRHLLRASVMVVMITVVIVVAPVTYAVTANLRSSILVTLTYFLLATLGLCNVYWSAPQTIAALRGVSRSAPSTFVWDPERTLVLRHPLAERIFLTLGSIPMAGIGVAGLLGRLPFPGASAMTAVLCSLSFVALGAYCALETNVTSIVVDQTGIVHRSPWRRRRSVPWREVRGYCGSEFGYSTIYTEQGKVWVSDSLSGSSELGLRLRYGVLE